MPELVVYNTKGEKISQIELPFFLTIPVNHTLLHRYVTWLRNVIRNSISNSKTRGEVSGGGKKPWKQKGTGRARVGSSRSPIWRHGGITFGPSNERNWHTRMPRKERQQALFSVLSAKVTDNEFIIIDSLPLDKPSVKGFMEIMSALPIEAGKKVLFVNDTHEVNLFKSIDNIPNFTTSTLTYMNALNLLNHDYLLMTESSFEAMKNHFNA